MSDREENADAAHEREHRQEALGDALRIIVRTFGVDPRVIGRWRNTPLPGSHLSPAQIADDGRYLSVLLARLRAIVVMSDPGSPPADHLMGLPFEDLQAQRREELRARTLAAEEAARLQAAHPAAETQRAADAAGRERQASSRFIDDIERRARDAFGDVAGEAWLDTIVRTVCQASVNDVRFTLTSADRAKIEAALRGGFHNSLASAATTRNMHPA